MSIGTELTTGQYVDTNAAWLSAELTRLGVSVAGHLTVADDIEAIQAAMAQALHGAALVIATGGLGPTPDDLTRQGLSRAIGQPLEENAEALARIRALFDRRQRAWSDSNRRQALIPRGCGVIPNEHGTAPGIRYVGDTVELLALPGVPSEMKAMFQASVVPIVSGRAKGRRTHAGRLLCYGVSEARMGDLLADLMARGRNPQVGTAASHGMIRVEVLAFGDDAAEAKHLCASDLAEIRRRLGAAVFGEDDDTLESVVGDGLAARGRTVSTAESCTGGLLAKRLTDVPGSSAYFLRGYVTYSNESKSELLHVAPELIAAEGAVSEPVARAMASGCRTAAGSDYALSITGIAGPAGGNPPKKPVGLVYLGLAGPDAVAVKRVLFGEHLTRDEIRDRASSAALNLLRLHLLKVDV